MKWSKDFRKISAFFIICIFAITIKDASSSSYMEAINNRTWDIILGDEAYSEPNQSWITYATIIPSGISNSRIFDFQGKNLRFKWKADKSISEGRFRKIYLSNNGTGRPLYYNYPNDGWKYEIVNNIDEKDNLKLTFNYDSFDGRILIAFPIEAESSEPIPINHTPKTQAYNVSGSLNVNNGSLTNCTTPSIIFSNECIFNNISTMDELREAINSPSCMTGKKIILKCSSLLGPLYINKSNITIERDANQSKIILNASGCDYGIAIENARNVNLKNLTEINGDNGLIIENASQICITDMEIESFKYNGIFINKCPKNITITNNRIVLLDSFNSAIGINVSESSHSELINNFINIGYDNSSITQAIANGYFDINLHQSKYNNISFRGSGLIRDDGNQCFVQCDGDFRPLCDCACDPYRFDPSVMHTCDSFAESNFNHNTWQFSCNSH